MKSFFIVVVLMLRNGGAQTRISGAPRAKESEEIIAYLPELGFPDLSGVY